MIEIFHDKKAIASFIKDNQNFIIDYKDFDIKNSIALSLPNSQKIYLYEHKFPPFLESFLPEGYLYEVFKNILSKEYGKVDDYLIFSLLASNIKSRIEFKNTLQKSIEFPHFDIEDILQNDTKDTFSNLLEVFLSKNSISGVQPKTVAILREKEKLESREYIIKTWQDEYQDLALNEYFCLKTVEKAGLKTAKVELSKNNKFLIVEKFTPKSDGGFYGFEEILSLMGKNRDRKYDGSHEQVAKTIYAFATNKKESMVSFYKTVVMNYLLKNGDAHLKNFGLLFDDDFSNIFFSPVYDVVNTVVYIYKDKPALTLNGKKIWWSKEALIRFGQTSCLLSQAEARDFYQECFDALLWGIEMLEEYLLKNPDFKIGKKMLDSWKHSTEEITTKELSDDVIRAWREY